VVTLEVAKQAALYHGLATMLNQPSPELSRGKGDGADLSFDEGDDELSGDDVELLEAGGGMNYMYNNYNGYMRASCSSTTLLASDNMHSFLHHLFQRPIGSQQHSHIIYNFNFELFTRDSNKTALITIKMKMVVLIVVVVVGVA